MIAVSKSMFLDRSKVFKALDKKRRVVLLRTGGYTRKIMRNSMKRAKKDKAGAEVRTVTDDGREVTIDYRGRVKDVRGRFLPRAEAARVRARAAASSTKSQAPSGGSRPGEPPRYRVGTLRNKIHFGYDPQTQSVIVGPELFATKTTPVAGKTTPELLNEGGGARITTPLGVTAASYAPRPFTPPAEAAGVKFFHELIESTPLK